MASIVLACERRLTAAPAEARLAVVRCLRSQDFTVTSEQVSVVTAKRGSQVFGAVQPTKLPVTATARFSPSEGGCTVAFHLADAWKTGAGRVWGENGLFRAVLEAVQATLDEALEPFAAAGFAAAVADERPDQPDAAPAPTGNEPSGIGSGGNGPDGSRPGGSGTDATAVLVRANEVAGRIGSSVGSRADELLGSSRPAAPRALKEVVLRSSKGLASFDRIGVQGLLTVGLLVSSKPGSMPANLARDVEALSARIEGSVERQPQGRVVVDLTDEEIPVAEFLGRQAALRDRLPLRELHVCTTCKLERVVNPDFAKLQEKIQRKKVLTGALGGTISGKGISPFLVVSSLFKLKNFDTPFVCQRCQGLDADSSIVTYCPQCGERRGEAVLRVCPRCDFRFPAVLRGEADFWGPLRPIEDPVPAAPAVAPPPPLARPAAAAPAPAAGWYPDQTGRHGYRYWDGRAWTGHVRG